MRRHRTSKGFTILELLIATLIAAAVCAGAVQLFHQNERIFRDQSIVVEMQQSARAALALIADDIRFGGQGVPVYAAAAHGSMTEAAVVILNGSTSHRIHFRAGFTDLDSFAQGSAPLNVSVGTRLDVGAPNAAAYSSHIGTAPQGRYLYLWNARDGWVRAEIHAVSGLSKILSITAVGGSSTTVPFTASPAMSLEEAIAIFHDTQTRSIRRASSTSMTDPAAPVWAPANEIAAQVVALEFRYFDAAGTRLPALDSLALRNSVAGIEITVSVQAASPLSDGTRPVHTLSQRSIPRNLAIR